MKEVWSLYTRFCGIVVIFINMVAVMVSTDTSINVSIKLHWKKKKPHSKEELLTKLSTFLYLKMIITALGTLPPHTILKT